MVSKKPAKRYIGLSPEAVAREYASEDKFKKRAEMEADIELLKTEIESLKKRVFDLEQAAESED